MTDRSAPWRDIAEPADIARAFGLLTRLPVPVDGPAAMARGGRAAWAWPLAGAGVGAAVSLIGLAALWADLPLTVAAGLVLLAQVMLTGALHEDGLADSADGLWGGHSPDRRLEIMRDSRIGTFGALALILTISMRWAALVVLLPQAPWALVAVGALSRLPMVWLMALLPSARPGGLSAAVGRPPQATVWLATGVALALALPWVWAASLALLPPMAVATFAVGRLARARIGGQTGDILGASQQVAELVALLVLSAGA